MLQVHSCRIVNLKHIELKNAVGMLCPVAELDRDKYAHIQLSGPLEVRTCTFMPISDMNFHVDAD